MGKESDRLLRCIIDHSGLKGFPSLSGARWVPETNNITCPGGGPTSVTPRRPVSDPFSPAYSVGVEVDHGFGVGQVVLPFRP